MSTLAWLQPATPWQRCGVKGPRAAQALREAGLAVPSRPNSWAPLTDTDRDDSLNVVGRLGHTEFFLEEQGAAPGITRLRERLDAGFPGAYPVLREDTGIVLGGDRACDVLAEVCNVEFAALTPASRPVVMTLMTGVAVLVMPQSVENRTIHRIWCDPSFGLYLWKTLEEVVDTTNGRGR